jgi:hypothetical protein
MQVGFAGLGNMGAAVAGHMLSPEHALTVWNRSADKARGLRDRGAAVASSIDQAVTGDVVFSMLADDHALQEALLSSGAFDRARPGIIHVNLSTISVELAQKLGAFHRARGQHYISAPVLGRPDVAQAGQLIVVAAGPAAALQTVQPLLESFSRKLWIVGVEAEKANAVKLAVNLMLTAAIEAMSESAALVGAYGLTAAQLLDITNTTLFACPVYQGYGKAIAEAKYEPAGFPVYLGAKDVRLGLAAAEAMHVPMPVASAVRDSFLQARAMGAETKDIAVLGEVARARAGLT